MNDDSPGVMHAEHDADDPSVPAADGTLCHNCEEPLSGEPVYFDGEAYCCTGCVNGGPCVCTYTTRSGAGPTANARTAEAFALTRAPRRDCAPAVVPSSGQRWIVGGDAPRSNVAGSDRAPGSSDATADAPAAGTRIVLRVGAFASQVEQLRFASDLEQDPRVAEVSLIRGVDLADSWLAVRADSTVALDQALHDLDTFEVISSTVLPGGMEARVRAVSAAESARTADVLPPRQRPRIAWTDRPREEAGREPALGHSAAARAAAGVDRDARTDDGASRTVAAQPIPPAASQPVPPSGQPATAAEHAGGEASPPLGAAHPADRAEGGADAMHAADQAAAGASTPATAASTPAARPLEPAASPRPVDAGQAVAPEPQPAASASAAPPADQDDRLVGVDERPGGAVALTEHVTLVVYPFRSFGVLNEFQSAIRDLRGIKNVRVRRFYKGTLHLAVEYEDVIPLLQRLHDLHAFPWDLVSESRTELEIKLDTGRPLAAGQGDG